jgi:hypothetical protein
LHISKNHAGTAAFGCPAERNSAIVTETFTSFSHTVKLSFRSAALSREESAVSPQAAKQILSVPFDI